MSYNYNTYKRKLNIIGRNVSKPKIPTNYINLFILELEDIEKRLSFDETEEKQKSIANKTTFDFFGFYLLKKEIKSLKTLIWRKQNGQARGTVSKGKH